MADYEHDRNDSQDGEPMSSPSPDGDGQAATPADDPVDAEAALDAAHGALQALQREDDETGEESDGTVVADSDATFSYEKLDSTPRASRANGAGGIEMLSRVNLNVRVELGRTRMLVEDVLRLNEGAVVELDKLAGDPVDIYVNDRHIARGEILVLNDTFCVRVSEILPGADSDKEPDPKSDG